MDPSEQRIHRSLAFERMEALVQEMQDPLTGVPVRSQKQFLTSIPSAFTGYDVIEWLMERLKVDDPVEAVNIANQLCHYGYFFPVNDSKNLVVKDDGSLYRFQIPYYWPSHQTKNPDNIDYAIFLVKRNLRNKQRHGLEDFEIEILSQLRKNLANKWNFITVQAEEQVKLSKDRKKGEKIVSDSQEKAYWRVHRPPPGYSSSLEPIPLRAGTSTSVKKQRCVEDIKKEIEFLKTCIAKTRQKVSVALESLMQFSDTYAEYDPMLTIVQPANPWVADDITYWQLNSPIVEIPTEKRVKRWAISMKELVTDPTGLHEFTNYLTKEYCLENIRFWMAVNDLRRSTPSTIVKKVQKIYDEYLAANAKCQINIDGKTTEKTLQEMTNPSRFTFDAAADHVYTLLLKKDCYPRFIRSEHYKNLLVNAIQPTGKKGKFDFFGFGNVQTRAKNNPTGKPLPCGLQAAHHQPSTSGAHSISIGRRRGSDKSLSGSTHELAVPGSKGSHFHSQSNITDVVNRELNESMDKSGDEVCPWDFPDPPERPHLQPSASVTEDTLTPDYTATSSVSRKNSTILDSSSSSDISSGTGMSVMAEVTERLKKTCGLHDFGRFARRSSPANNSKHLDSKRPSVSSTEDLTPTPFRSFDSNPSGSSDKELSVANNATPPGSTARRRSITTFIGRKYSSSNPTPLISVSSVSEQNEEKSENPTVVTAASTSGTTTASTGLTSKLSSVFKKSESIDLKATSSKDDVPVVASTSRDSKTDKGEGTGTDLTKANSPNEVCPWEDEENCKVKASNYMKFYETLGYL